MTHARPVKPDARPVVEYVTRAGQVLRIACNSTPAPAITVRLPSGTVVTAMLRAVS